MTLISAYPCDLLQPWMESYTLVLISPDESRAGYMRQMLQSLRCDLYLARTDDADSAISIAWGDRHVCFVVDATGRRHNALKFIRTARIYASTQPVIALVDEDDDAGILQATRLGANGVLLDPGNVGEAGYGIAFRIHKAISPFGASLDFIPGNGVRKNGTDA